MQFAAATSPGCSPGKEQAQEHRRGTCAPGANLLPLLTILLHGAATLNQLDLAKDVPLLQPPELGYNHDSFDDVLKCEGTHHNHDYRQDGNDDGDCDGGGDDRHPDDPDPANDDDVNNWKDHDRPACDCTGGAVLVEDNYGVATSADARPLVARAAAGLLAGYAPSLAAEGMGGTYVMCGPDGAPVGVLKPADEEPLAPNNPRGNVGSALGAAGLKPSVRVGEAAVREVAAHLLDHGGFARVPASALVRARHGALRYGVGEASTPKLASLQAYVEHECDMNDVGPGSFATADVHRIGILDIRLFNTDRHAGNILVRHVPAADGAASSDAAADSPCELVPIDHGFCLPETLDAPYFEWLHWPQAKQPFSADELAYIRSLDAAADAAMLRARLPQLRPGSLRVLQLTTALLQRCADAGMTLFDIGSLLTRPFLGGGVEGPSPLERMCLAAKSAPIDATALLACAGDAAFAVFAAAAAKRPTAARCAALPAAAPLTKGALMARPEEPPSKAVVAACDTASEGLSRLWGRLTEPQPPPALSASATVRMSGVARCPGGCCAGGAVDEVSSWDAFSDASWRWFFAQVLLRLEAGLLAGFGNGAGSSEDGGGGLPMWLAGVPACGSAAA
uniref:1-phosphatidylinositol 4-kinase n=1 Tax=Chlamydomonas euryale TaxID=1486919 RepID=A0A7R9V548_9CHLO|mmetsp:Transcript_16506/g.49199  ORF Transcript_16506/g.49199 Transcript_16506/m.49199 type:complete len:622 (+) Transcript_16506:248-2113(+)